MGNQDNLGTNNSGINDGLMPPSLLESASLEDNSPLIELQKSLKNSLSFDPVNLLANKDSKSASLEDNKAASEQNLVPNYNSSVSDIFGSGQSFIQPQTSVTSSQQNNQNIDSLTGEPSYQTTTTSYTASNSIPNFAIRSEGTITINGNSDLDGVPTDPTDDALIYAAKGFTINGNSILPVQRDAAGNPLKDASGKLILVDKAVAVSTGYTVANAPNNKYANLVPPQLVDKLSVNVPLYADIKQLELARRIPSGTPTVTFNASQNPLNNANDWSKKFPQPGTASTPTVVRVTGGGLNIPSNITLNNYVIIVEQGDINFNGNNHNFNNVALITNNGNINLSNVQAKELAVFASGSINMNGGAKFTGTTLLANGNTNGSIIFNGATSSINPTDNLRVISQGDIIYNGASNTRGSFLSVKNFTYNGNSTLYGTIGAKGNITFNGGATVIQPDALAPVVTASLLRDTAPGNTTNTDKITSDPAIVARISDNSPILELRAGFNSTTPADYKTFQPQYNADGSFTISRAQLESIYGTTLPDGIYTLHLQAVDFYGNLSNIYNLTFYLDTKTLTPNNLDLTANSDTGTSNTDNITNKNQPTITGNAEAGTVVKLSNNGQLIGTGVANSSGVWQIVTSTLTDGIYNITASAEDIAGNVSSSSTPLQIVVDTIAPNAPTLKLATNSDTGISNSDKITKNSTPTLQGNAASGSIVRLYKEGQLIGQTTASANGTWELQTQTLTDGQHIFTATAEDVAGNKSAVSSQLTITVDTQIAPPSNLNLVVASDSGISNSDRVTQDSTPTISGNAEAFSTVQLFHNGQLLGQTTTLSNGTWQFTTNNLADGTYNITAIASDIAGNVSTSSTPLNFTIDTVLPQLTLVTPVNTQSLQQTSRLIGTVDGTGSTVVSLSYRFDQLPEIAVPLSANGAFDQAFDLTGIANGQHTLTLVTTDLAGNTKTIQYNVTVAVDNEAPIITATLQRDTAPGNTTNSDRITFDPSIRGTVSDTNQIVSFRAGFAHTSVANFIDVLPQRQADGSFSFNRTQLEQIYGGTLPDGQHILTLQAVDSSGNVSGLFAIAFTLDTTTPAPTLELSKTSDSGISNSDLLTNDATPTITGTAEAGAFVQLFSDGQQIGQTTANTDGSWQIVTSDLTDGIHNLSASVTDIAGNTNSSVSSLAVTIDTALPQLTLSKPVNQSPLRSGDKLAGSIDGTGSNITSLSYRFNNGAEIAISHNASGAFEQELDLTGLGNGIHILTITALDAAGNRLTTQYNVTVQLDETAPVITASLANDTAPGGTTNNDFITFDPTIRGNVVDTSRVAQFKAGFDNTPIANFIDVFGQLKSDGTFSLDKSQLILIYGSSIPDGLHTLHLVAEDEFGNLTEVYNFTFTLDTSTPIPSNLDLPSNQDTGENNSDNITRYSSSNITGNAEAKASIQIVNSANGQVIGQTTADIQGLWQITTDNLADGTYSLNAIATDTAGNISNISTITITIDSTAPTLLLTTLVDTIPLQQGARLEGSINGTGSAIATASYSFDNQTLIPLFLDTNGSFDQQLDFTGLSNGVHSLTITVIDIAGNVTTQQHDVTVNLDTSAPVITATLLQDSAPGGTSNSDRITFDPTIVGRITDNNTLIEVKASLNNQSTANFADIDITNQIQPDGSFKLNRTKLETIFGSTLADGVYTLRLVAKDEFSNVSPVFEYIFTLDTNTPAPSNLDLTSDSDRGVNGSDNITNLASPTITGQAEAGAKVELSHSGQLFGTATADSTGNWQLVTSNLTDGTYNFTAVATDIAGNVSNQAIPLQVIIDRVVPQLVLTAPIDATPLTTDTKLTGYVSGTGTAVTSLSYRFNNQSEVNVSFDATGRFEQQLDLTGLSSGSHLLTLIASDTAGNITTIAYNVIVNSDTAAPVITANLSNDTAIGGMANNDKITADPAITGKLTDVSRIVNFRAGFNNTLAANFVDVLEELGVDGSFSFNRTQLEAIYGGILPDGAHTLRLVATDEFGNQSNAFSFTFTLDTKITQPVFNLDAISDSGTVGDKKTKFDTVTLTGLTEPGATVVLITTGSSVIADNTGKFSFSNISLVAGDNTFNVQATDIAGNQSTYITTIYRFSAPTAINLSATSIAENSVNGTIVGQFSSVDSDSGENHTYSLVDDAQGRFKIVGNQLQVADHKLLDYENSNQHTITIRSTDAQGLSKTQEFTIAVTNINEAPSFTSTPTNTTVESGSTYTYNITTTDPDAGDRLTITATEIPSWLTFTDNGDGTGTLTGTPNENQLGLFNLAFKVQDDLGLNNTQNIIISSQINLREETYFTATRTLPLVIPATASFLTFKIDPTFDTSNPNAINDAFEVALVDENGKSLVHTIASNRDAFFNLTEGENAALGTGTSYNAIDRTVRLNLTGIQSGNAKLIFRLVNNDGDTATNVNITEFALQIAPEGTQAPLQSNPGFPANTVIAPDFNYLTDVSQSFNAEYYHTSYNVDTHLLYTDIAVHNFGTYSIDTPLLVAIKNISDPRVVVRNPDGFTPEGVPYYNFSNLVADGKLDAGELTKKRSLVFYNPQQVQFNYELVILAQLNQAPIIQTQANTEITGGQSYSYQVKATDPNGDVLGYELLAAPDGMTINSETGLINWNTTTNNIGNHTVVVEVSDGRGGITQQNYTLSVIDTPPNRPPIFTSNPVVDAAINTLYHYDANAIDPDGDNLNYSLKLGPDGMTIDQTTGEVRWTPTQSTMFGDTVLGRINNPGEKNTYTFSMVAGERIYFDPLKYTGNYYDWKVQIISPSGKSVLDSNYYFSGPLTLTETGNYRLIIDPNADITGEYGFSLINIDATPIATMDSNISGVLSPGTEDDIYRFKGKAGTRLYFDNLTDNLHLNSYLDWVIYSPNNSILSSNNWNDMEIVLPSDGEYIVALRGNWIFNGTVPYTFRIVTPETNTASLTLGNNENPHIVSNAILEKGEQDIYTFTGSIGQRLSLDTITSHGTNIAYLESPSGIRIFERDLNYGNLSPFTLAEAGTYRLIIDGYGESTGAYSFSIVDVSAATTISLDSDVNGQFNPEKQTHFYQFEANAGQRLYLDSLISVPNTSWDLIDSSNKIIATNSMNYDQEVIINNNGTYFLAISGFNDSPVDYSFHIITSDTKEKGTLTLNNHTSSIIGELGEQHNYTFNASVGQRLYFDSIIGSSYITAKILSPSGIEVWTGNTGNDSYPFVLVEAGTYRLIVDGYENTTGDYDFRLLDVSSSASSLTLGIPKQGSFNANSTVLFNIKGSAGQKLKFDSLQITGNADWVLYSPGTLTNGQTILGSASLSQDFEVFLPTSGDYILALRNADSSVVNYNIQVSSISSPSGTNSNLGIVRSGSITTSQQVNHTFTAKAGTFVYFDSQISYTELITASILDSQNNVISTFNASVDQGLIQLTNSGNYTLKLEGIGSYKYRLLDLEKAANIDSNLNLSSSINGDLTPSSATIVYKFTGSIGKQLFYDALNNNVSSASVKLFSPSGRLLFNIPAQNDLGPDAGLTLNEAGTYYLVVSGTGETINTPVSFRLLDKANAKIINLETTINITGTFANGGMETDLYRFLGKKGEQIYLDWKSGEYPDSWILYGPGGQYITSNYAPGDGEFVLPGDGEYLLAIQGNDTSNVNYEFSLVTPQLTSESLSLNTQIHGYINEAGENDTYTFLGNVGQQLYFDALNTNTPNFTVRVFTPSGKELYSAPVQNNRGSETQIGDYGVILPGLILSENGTYRLVIDGDRDAVGDYSFRLLDKADATRVSLNTDITGSFVAGGRETVLYRFTATGGQRIFVNFSDAGTSNNWTLYGTGGQSLGSGGLTTDNEFTLANTGEYLLALANNGDENTNYKIHIGTPEFTTTALTFGNKVSGLISQSGENDTYTFSGIAGQKLYFDALNIDPANFTVRLITPSGKQQYSGPVDSDRGSETQNAWFVDYPGFLLSETGTYRLVVDGNGDATGNYDFRIFDSNSAHPLTFNQDISGTFDFGGKSSDVYKFTANAGQYLYFDQKAGGTSNQWLLYGVNGELVPSIGYGLDNFGNPLQVTARALQDSYEWALPSTGEYFLVMKGNGDSEVNYTFHVATPQFSTTALALGTTINGSITKAGENDTYTFTGSVGQKYFFDALNTDNPNLTVRLYTPSGRELYSGAVKNDRGSETYSNVYGTFYGFELPEAGTYRLVIDGDRNATGNYSFRLSSIADAPSLVISSPTGGSLDPGNEVDLYQFTGTIGQQLHFDFPVTAISEFNWLVYGTNGQIIANSGTYSPDSNLMLPTSGLYALAIIGDSTDPINYSFTVTDQTPTPVPTTGLGITQSGTIAVGQVADYTFTAASGTRIYFDSLDADNDEVQVTLLNPDGTPVFQGSASTDNYQIPIQLQQSGTYTLRVQGYTDESTGDYQYRILELPSQTPDPRENENSLQLGISFGKTLLNGRATEVYSFTGTTGQQIYLDSFLPPNGVKQATLQLFAPSGERLLYDFAQNYYQSGINFGPLTLEESGTYNFLVSSEEDTLVDYRYQILDLAAAASVEFNQKINGNLQPGSATSFYQINGTAGQRLYFDSIAGSSADWKLYRNANLEVLASTYIGNDLEVVLPADGKYTLGIIGNAPTVTSYSFRVVTPGEKTAIITPDDGEGGGIAGDDLGTYRVRIDVNDGQGGTSFQDFRIRITPELGNHTPVINSEAITSGYANKKYLYDVDATDAEGDSLTYLLTDAPSGMFIDSLTGKIIWATPTAGTHKVKVRVEDGRGGIETQSFELQISDATPGTIKGTVYLDQDGDGKWTVTNPGNITPDTSVTIGDRFKDNYTAYNLGRPIGVPGILGTMTFKQNADGSVDPNTLLLGAGAASSGGAIYEVKILRGEGGHIIGFDDDNDPETLYYANYFADSPYSDAGLVYTPDNILLANMWPRQGVNIINPGGAPKDTLPYALGGLALVPEGLPGAGQLKATGLWPSNGFYTLNYSPDGTFADGTPKLKIDSVEYETNVGAGPGAFVYINQTAPNFESGPGVLVAEWNVGQINAYDIDSNGNPVASTQELFVGNYGGAWGATKDPVTGDLIFSSWGGHDTIIVRGLGKPADNEAGIKDWIVYVDADRDGVRDADEQFTYTDSRGNYSFTLDPGTYRIAQELQPGWTQTSPINPKYWDVTVAANDTKFSIDFGNTNSKLAGDNVDPEFTSTAVTQVTTGEKYLYRATATDLNADNLTYELVLKPEGMAIAPNGTISWRPGNEQVGKHQVIVRVSDGRGGVDLQAYEVEVMPGNRAPSFTSVAPNIVHSQALKQFQYQAKALDLDGDSITYEIVPNTVRPVTPGNATIDSTTGLVTWTPTVEQTGGAFNWEYSDQLAPWQILIRATDGKGGEAFQQLNLIVDPQAPNRLPEITSLPRNNTRLGETYLYKVVATDPDNDVLTYSLQTAPAGMKVENGIISWTPTAAQFGDNEVVLQVTDGEAIIEQRFKVNVGNQITNYAPVITSAPDFTTNAGRDSQYQLTATDADGDVLRWALDDAPDGMVIDSDAGTLSWKPSLSQIGEHSFKVFVLDTHGAFATQEFTLSVTGINAPPAIVSNPVTKAALNQQYTYNVIANDPENDALTFSLGRSPAGMIIDNNGVIRWTPQATQVGQQEVEVLVTDGQGAVTTQIYTIEVGTTAINHAPSITSTPVYVANVGSAYQYQVQATDPDAGDRLTYQLLSVPAGVTGITIDATTGLLTWQNPVAGNYRVVVGAVDDGGLGAAQGFSLTARANNAPVIRSTPVLTATPGSAYAYDVIAADVDGDRLSYTLDQASRDKGITLDTLGRLRWNPTVSNVGTHRIVLSVSDGITSTPQQYDLVVAADQEAPKVSLIANYNTVDLGGTVTFQARATDNLRVAGLQLLVNGNAVVLDANGMARFTPTSAGTIFARAIATDTAGNIGQATFDVAVIDTSDVNAPEVSLNLGAIAGKLITSSIDIRGSISDDGQIDYYRLLVAPVAGGEFKQIAFVDNPNAIANGVLGKFDPSLLQNDSYILRLEVADNGGNISYAEQVVDVAGELKLGNFRLSFTDLTVPVTGIPITLTRTYDTLTSGITDDFGYGWRLEFRDTDLRTSLRPPSEEEALIGYQSAFKDGTRVYITLPGGKREAFTFRPTVDPIFGLASAIGGVNSTVYKPAFVGDKGVTSTLTVKSARILRKDGTDEYVGLNGGINYNPADVNFGNVYVLTTKEGIVYEIDAATGDLLTVTDTNGNKLTYTDDGIYSSSGKQVTFERDAQGRIAAVKDPMGELIRYTYDAKGDLISVTDREGNTTRMEYNQERSHYLDKIIDPLNRTGIRNEYGDDGRLKEIVDVNGQKVEMSYDPNNSRQTVLDQLGHATIYEYDARGNILTEIDAEGQITKRKYDDNNNVLEETVISDHSGRDGFTTKYTYDNKNNLLTQEDALGNITRYTYGAYSRLLTETDALGRTTINAYDSYGNLSATKDALGKVTSYGYDGDGQLTSVTDANKQTTRFDYDANGNVTQVTDALGNVTKYTYNRNGDKLTETRYMTLANGQVRELLTQWTYDDNGRMKTMTDAENHTTTYEYDALGQQTAVIDALQHRTEYKYNERGELVETIYADNTPDNPFDNLRDISRYDAAGRTIATIDKAGRETRFIYDKVGRLFETILPDNTPNSWDDNPRNRIEYYTDGLVKATINERGSRTEYRYDAAGRQVEIIHADDTYYTLDDNPRTTFKYDKVGQQISQTDALNHTIAYKYDDLGRLTKTEFNDKTYTTSEYDNLGRRIAITDQNSKRIEYRYDALGRLTGVKNALKDWTEYGYNEVGNLIWIEDANDHRTNYEYDGLGRRIAVILPMDQRSDTVYDAVGNLKSYTDFNRNTTTYQYDAMNWMTTKQFQDESKVTYTHTDTGLQDVVAFVDANGVITATYDYDYDERDRLIQRTDNIAGVSRSISYTYDAASNRTSVTTASGTVNYTFDVRNRLDKVSENGIITADYDYDAVSNLVRTTFANGTSESRQYDDLNRLKYLENRQGDTVFSSYTYILDKVGNRTKVVEQNGRTVDYTYDDLYRLTQEKITDAVNGNRIYDYTFDKVGNRMTKSETANNVTTITNYAYDDNDQLLNETVNQQAVVNYTYDNNGNTLTKTDNGITTEYTWDYENRLNTARVKDVNGAIQQSMQYQYNDNGIRVASTVNGVETRYLIDEMQPYDQVLEEYSLDGTVQVEYVYGNDLIAQKQDNSRNYYHVDGLGSTRLLTDVTGSIVSNYNYEAYGELINSTGRVENKYLFAGEQYDEELDNYYLRQRYYDTSAGRFIRKDSYAGDAFDPITLHKYIYANVNPVNGIDPSGLTTLMEQSVVNKEIGQQAATTSTFTPFVLQAARVAAGFLTLAAGVVSYILIEEAKKGKKDQFEYKLYPDDETREKIDKLNDKDVNQMRVQLQYKKQYDYGIALLNVPEVGVNQTQVFNGLWQLWLTRRNATWFPMNRYESNLVGAIVYVSKEAKYIGPTDQGRYQVASGQWYTSGKIANTKKGEKGDYRVDLENLRGENLRNPVPRPPK